MMQESIKSNGLHCVGQCFTKGTLDADDQPVDKTCAETHAREDQKPGSDAVATAARGVHQGIHHDAEEAEFGPTESCACQVDERHGSHILYPRCWPQSPRTFHCLGEGWSREGSSRRAVPSGSRRARCRWRPKSPAESLQVRDEAPEAGSHLSMCGRN